MRYFERDELDYVPYYCEENVWRLLRHESLHGMRAWALLVSNAERRVIFLRQRSGRPVDGLVQWDYHALVLVEDSLDGFLVLDLDSDLPLPSPLRHYLESSFPEDAPGALVPKFRAVPARDYLTGLVSDRSHMKRSDGSWLAPPPPWDYPGHRDGMKNNLMEWTDMGLRNPGRVLSLTTLRSISTANRPDDMRLPR